jgi:hypothetical protein
MESSRKSEGGTLLRISTSESGRVSSATQPPPPPTDELPPRRVTAGEDGVELEGSILEDVEKRESAVPYAGFAGILRNDDRGDSLAVVLD